MSNLQRGFTAPLLLALIAVLLVGGGAYIYADKRAQTADWKIFSTTTAGLDDYGPIGDNPSPQLTSFSFQYPSGWSVCEKVSLDTEYVTVSDDCSSNGGKPFRFPTNYFQVRNVGALEDSSPTDIGWKTIESDSTNGPEPVRAIYFQSKNITLVLVGLNSDTQSTLDRIASTFKFIDVVTGRVCGAGIMGGRDSCPTGYICKFPPNHSPGADDGACVKN